MKKFAVILFAGMLAIGASSYVAVAQNQPTGAPDTSVTAKPKTAPVAPSVEKAKPVQQEATKESNSSALWIIVVAGVFVIGGITVVLLRRKQSRK